MNNQHVLGLVAASILTITACKKDSEELPAPDPSSPEPTAMAWAQLKPGSYWIYQRFQTDTAGVETPLAIYDSCYVGEDTVIAGLTYHTMVRPTYGSPGPKITRERVSQNYLLDPSNRILFASDVFDVVFDDDYITSGSAIVAHVTTYMTDDGLVVNTPAGAFSTKSFVEHYDIAPSYVVHYAQYDLHTRYAEGVGIVQEIMPFYLSSPFIIDRRLVSYHLEP
jgi:hypothetical protein